MDQKVDFSFFKQIILIKVKKFKQNYQISL